MISINIGSSLVWLHLGTWEVIKIRNSVGENDILERSINSLFSINFKSEGMKQN